MERVVTGLERWLTDPAAKVERGARVGLLLHPASVDSRGHHALERCLEHRDLRVERLFAPEHGLFGHEQDMECVGSTVERSSGLPVVSWYGHDAASLRPRAEHLEGLDVVVCDLQDVGSRYYTFVYTLSYLMESARDADIAVVVLDRPNPIGGALEGPILDPSMSSFVGRYALPVRHGMTIGELATMFNEHFAIGCRLTVIEMLGWSRSMLFDSTGLPWVPPSPNMPTLATAIVYPGGCLIEGTNLSEGRGTTTPFELVGAPWLDAVALARSMRARSLPGLEFRPASFRPSFQKHAGLVCEGVQILVGDRDRIAPFSAYIELIREARRQRIEAFAWRTEAYEFERDRLAIDLLLGCPGLRERIEADQPLAEIEAGWSEPLREFEASRRRYLRYP